MPKLSKRVERLRAFLRTKKQADDLIENLEALGSYTTEEKDLMESFKRIYHGGTQQLEKFIDLLDATGKKLDSYSVIYYTRQLINGPLQNYVKKLVTGKKFWKASPDGLGVLGNLNKSNIQIPILEGLKISNTTLNDNVVTVNKIPPFMFTNSKGLTEVCNSMFALAFQGSINLEPQLYVPGNSSEVRLLVEPQGTYNRLPHGSYVVSDGDSWLLTQQTSSKIFQKVKDTLGEEDYNLYAFKKTYNPFDPNDNISATGNTVVARKLHYEIKDPDTGTTVLTSVTVNTDLYGGVFESDDVRKFAIKIVTPVKDIPLSLHTVHGQLGGIDEIKPDPLTD
jgi:hypothetical protein